MNISGTLDGGSEGDSNKIVKSLPGVVVVEGVVNVLVVVNVVEGGKTELLGGVTGNEKGWPGKEILVYKAEENEVVIVLILVIVVAVLEPGPLVKAAGAIVVVFFGRCLGMAGEVGCRTLNTDLWAGVVVVMSVLGGVNFPVLVLFFWEFL